MTVERPRGASEQFGSVAFPMARRVSPHGQISAVSMMKDEGPYVIEWIAHHLAIGFTDLVVYTNDCSDGTDDMLIRLEELGLAHHRRNVIPEGLRPQPSAVNHAQDDLVVTQSDWVMLLDADEFLSIRYGDGTLDELLSAVKAQGANGIVATWRVFGSGGRVAWSRLPVTEQYLRAAPVDWNKGWGVKTLFSFDPEYWKLGIHRPKIKTKHLKSDFPDRVKWLNGSGREMAEYFKFRGWRSITRTVGYDWLQVNHYAVKSVESYALRRLRGNVNNKAGKYGSDYWSLQDRNEVPDDTMLRYSERRNGIIAMLLSDPVLDRLHRRAVDLAEARLADFRDTEPYRQLLAELARASAVPLGQVVAKPPQPRNREKIAARMSEVETLRSAKARDLRKADSHGAAPPAAVLVADANLSPDFSGDWVPNGGVLLPLDPGLFSSGALPLVAKGKLYRALARRLPHVIPQKDRVLELGSSLGFLAARLATTRPDIALTMQEDDPRLRAALTTIWARNGLALPDGALIADVVHDPASLQDLLDRRLPDSLLVAHPRLTWDRLTRGLTGQRPRRIFAYGEFLRLNQPHLEALDNRLADLTYRLSFASEPKLLRGYALASPDP